MSLTDGLGRTAAVGVRLVVLSAVLAVAAPTPAALGRTFDTTSAQKPDVAICKDDSTSKNSNFAATCKSQGGIKLWLARYVECGDGTIYRLNRRASCNGHGGLKAMLPVDYVPRPRSGDVALCVDGTYLKVKGFRSACGTRGGVRRWLSPYGRCNDDNPIRITRHATCAGHGGFRGLASDKVPRQFKGKVALCNDGNYSTNTDFAATCSGGDGIDTWLAKYGMCADGAVIVMSKKASCTDDEFKRLLDGDDRPKPTGSDRGVGTLYPDRPDQQEDDHEQAVGAEPVKFAGFSVWVLSATYVERASQYQCCGYVRVRVRIQNRDHDRQSWLRTDFSLLRPSGEVYSPAIVVGVEGTLGISGGLVEGGQVEGDVWFSVDPAAKGSYYVYWEPSFKPFETDRGIWQFNR